MYLNVVTSGRHRKYFKVIISFNFENFTRDEYFNTQSYICHLCNVKQTKYSIHGKTFQIAQLTFFFFFENLYLRAKSMRDQATNLLWMTDILIENEYNGFHFILTRRFKQIKMLICLTDCLTVLVRMMVINIRKIYNNFRLLFSFCELKKKNCLNEISKLRKT